MGRPLNKRNFGSDTIGKQIEVTYWNGAAAVTGYIVKQMGSKKFRVTTDGVTTFVCYLKHTGAPAADGEMTIGITDEAGTGSSLVRKISGRKATLANGEIVGWRYDVLSVGSDDRAEIDESAGFAISDDIAIVDAVTGVDYVIVDPGDTDFTIAAIGAADSNVGTTFTMGVGPGVGTGVVRQYDSY